MTDQEWLMIREGDVLVDFRKRRYRVVDVWHPKPEYPQAEILIIGVRVDSDAPKRGHYKRILSNHDAWRFRKEKNDDEA